MFPKHPSTKANTQTNEMVVVMAASSLEHRQSVIASVPTMFAQPRKISVRRISPVYIGQLTDSCRFQELFIRNTSYSQWEGREELFERERESDPDLSLWDDCVKACEGVAV